MKDIILNILTVIMVIVVTGLLIYLAHRFIVGSVETTPAIKSIEAKLDSISTRLNQIDAATDTIYVDVDDMSQADWESYTPTNKD